MACWLETVDPSNTASAYYAPATVAPAGKLVHVAGQPGSTKYGIVPADYESEIHLALLNLRKLIIAAGSSIENIVKLQLFIVDYDAANRKHAQHIQRFLAGHRPAITLIPVPKLAVASWLFEIDAIIAVPEPAIPPVLPATSENTDVVIIGAGLAGLLLHTMSCARGCLASSLKRAIVVATRRGAQPSMAVVSMLWRSAKVLRSLSKTSREMQFCRTSMETALHMSMEISPALIKLPKPLAEIRDMCVAECQALDTWRPQDTSLDSITFEAYLRSRGASEVAFATGMIWTRAMPGQDPKDISALYFLNYCKSGGGLLQMRYDRKNGGQYLRIQQAGGVVYGAHKIIIAVPTPAMKTISFHPKLPPAKQAWIESTTYGYYTKAMMEFRSPFWVKSGFCGLAQSFIGPDTLGPDVLRESAGNLHFAGTETAGEWKRYMEGAIRSGERAAAEVVKTLNAGIFSRL
ncbi:hypothetical protein N7537_011890 [Penicillium hordei]|uniref:monoamine oxidase n=1 Tax=Penicillium hordei TaxID=40994 RepID=A0AAD6DP04_9EURO|nr:uncharacterized protein N7537_011890 [Penicillium hordei]KAJ5589212.1 hypothetical protein N7537_011890 [Penicillium hordei]